MSDVYLTAYEGDHLLLDVASSPFYMQEASPTSIYQATSPFLRQQVRTITF